jgi:TonB family protein
MKQWILAALVLISTACPVWAQLRTGIAYDETERIILERATDEFRQDFYVKALYTGPDGSLVPVLQKVHCETMGSQNLEKARSAQFNVEVFIARYNLVDLLLGNVCHGKSDVLPSPEEAKAWLLGIKRPILGTDRMLVQLYLFGAAGSPPDYSAALALLKKEVKTKDSFPALDLSYIYEHGLGVPNDAVQSRVWLERAAEAGNIDAKMLLVQAKELRNEAEAFSSYLELSKSVAPPAWFRLGLMYLEGRGTRKDPCKAQEMFQKAATHFWPPVMQAMKYLNQIREQNLCPSAVPVRTEPTSTALPLQEPNRPPGGAVQSSTPEQGGPLSKLVISATGTGSSSSDGFGSRYGWYVQLVKAKVALAWHAPTDNNAAGHRVQIAFNIQPDGSPSNVRVEQSSGVPVLDESAIRAIQRIDSFGPPPTHQSIAVQCVFDGPKVGNGSQ